jgi:hypothetical protein
VLVRQFQQGIAGLSERQFARIVIAYEPVWAIGTGKTATPEIAAGAHRAIRGQVRAKFGKEAGEAIRILYGGSVKPDNTRSLMAQPEIDGVLVGWRQSGPGVVRVYCELLEPPHRRHPSVRRKSLGCTMPISRNDFSFRRWRSPETILL